MPVSGKNKAISYRVTEWSAYATKSFPRIDTSFTSVLNAIISIKYYTGARNSRNTEHFILVMDMPDSKVKVWQLCSSEDIQVTEMAVIEWESAN